MFHSHNYEKKIKFKKYFDSLLAECDFCVERWYFKFYSCEFITKKLMRRQNFLHVSGYIHTLLRRVNIPSLSTAPSFIYD